MLELTKHERVFRFRVDGSEYSIPAVTSAPAPLMSKMVGQAPQEQTDTAIAYVASILPDGLLDKLDTASLVELVTAWSKDRGEDAGGATLGESSPSSD